MEQRAAIKFCVKLKQIDIETFEMSESAYDEECLSRTSVSEWHKRYIEAQKVRMQKSRVKTMLTASSRICAGKQTINGEFHKEAIKSLIARSSR
jgi:hypothetical protein